MSEFYGGFSDRKEVLKNIIKRIHQGEDPEKVKSEFKEFLQEVQADEIAKIEEELIKEGMNRNEVMKLCEVHLAIFKEGLEKKEEKDYQNPTSILYKEHEIIINLCNDLLETLNSIEDESSFYEKEKNIEKIITC